MAEEKEISKIKLENQVYSLKDTEAENIASGYQETKLDASATEHFPFGFVFGDGTEQEYDMTAFTHVVAKEGENYV